MVADWRSLPEDLVVEVMAKLPAKSLFRFKCVSKKWRNLIGSSDFETLHYRRSINKPFSYLTTRTRLLNSNAEKLDLHIPSEFGYIGGRVISTSSGLVCIRLWAVSWLDFVVWNPATREYRFLWEPKNVNGDGRISSNCAGFDFRPRGGASDYKLGIICFYGIRECERSFDVGVYLYSKRSNSWKKIEKAGVPRMRVCTFKSVTLHGSIYWLAQEIHSTPRRQYVACFDMWREKFTRILTAPAQYSDDEYMRTKRLVTVNDGSSLAMFYYTGDSFDGWVMNDGNHSWSKRFSIVPRIPASATLNDTTIAGLWVKGEFVIDVFRGETYLYDDSTGELKHTLYGRHLYRYMETLFSPL